MSLIGRTVICKVPEEITHDEKGKELDKPKQTYETFKGVVVEKFRDSFQHPQGGTFVYDNLMLDLEGGGVKVIHPSTVISIGIKESKDA